MSEEPSVWHQSRYVQITNMFHTFKTQKDVETNDMIWVFKTTMWVMPFQQCSVKSAHF